MGLLYTEEQTATLHSLKLHGSTSFATTKTARPTAISTSDRILSAAAAFLLSHFFPLVSALQVITIYISAQDQSISKRLLYLLFDFLLHLILCQNPVLQCISFCAHPVFILCWF